VPVPLIPLALTLGSFFGSMLGLKGKLDENSAAAKAARYQADIADEDAVLADKNAQIVLSRATEEDRKVRVLARRTMGNMRATIGASGLTDEGNPVDLLEEAAATSEADSLAIRTQGKYESDAYSLQGRRKRDYAAQLRSGALDVDKSAPFVLGAGILGAVGDAAPKIPGGNGRMKRGG